MIAFGNPVWIELRYIVNIFFAGMLAFYSFKRARYDWGVVRWLRICLGLVALYWIVFNAFLFVVPYYSLDAFLFDQIFFWPPFSITLALYATLTYYRWRIPK